VDEKIFGAADIRRWAETGLITEAQSHAVLVYEAGSIAEATCRARNLEGGLTLVTVLAFFGAFLALLGFAVFVLVTWDEWSSSSRVLLTGVPAALLLASGTYIKMKSIHKLGGALLFMLGTALIPVFVGAAGQALTGDEFRSFREDADRLVTILAVSLGLTVAATLAGRVHYSAFVVATISILLIVAVEASRGYESDESLWWAALGASAAVVGAAATLYALRMPAYGLWTGNAGHIPFYVSTVYLL
jgi:hypothetical protein